MTPRFEISSEATRVVKNYSRAMETHDLKALERSVCEDFCFETSIEPLGKQDFIQLMASLFRAFPDWQFNHSNLRQENGTVLVTVDMTGTHTDVFAMPLPGFKPVNPTGKRIGLLRQSFRYSLRNGKICRIVPEAVPGGGIPCLLKHLGVKLPPPWIRKAILSLPRWWKRMTRGKGREFDPWIAFSRLADH